MVNELAVKQLQPGQPHMESYESELRTQVHAIYNNCPRDMAVDRGHALVRVAGVMQGGSGAPLSRRYLIRGLLGDGFSYADVALALKASDDEMRRAQGELPIHEPSATKLRELKARVLPVHGEQVQLHRSMSSAPARTGNLVRGSRGWRTPLDGFPQTQTPPHS